MTYKAEQTMLDIYNLRIIVREIYLSCWHFRDIYLIFVGGIRERYYERLPRNCLTFPSRKKLQQTVVSEENQEREKRVRAKQYSEILLFN